LVTLAFPSAIIIFRRDFLNQRFFLHLDQEHYYLLNNLKYDLIKYYLVNCFKKKNHEKILEFFKKYSHEIISDSGESVTGLRSWYVLPYMEEPEKDPEFSVYFTTRWSDMLRVTLNNFLSTILLNAPPPKLMLLEKWFRSEAQQEVRVQLRQASDNVDHLLTRLKSYEDRLAILRGVVKDLAIFVHHRGSSDGDAREKDETQSSPERTGDGSRRQEEVVPPPPLPPPPDRAFLQIQELGILVCRLATECVQQKVEGSSFQNLSHQRNTKAPPSPEEVEAQLIITIQAWLQALKSSAPSSS
jgi:hypothetical protein